MKAELTYTYWRDGRWFVGQVREVPGAISQGETLAALEDNLRDAVQVIRQGQPDPPRHGRIRRLLLVEA